MVDERLQQASYGEHLLILASLGEGDSLDMAKVSIDKTEGSYEWDTRNGCLEPDMKLCIGRNVP